MSTGQTLLKWGCLGCGGLTLLVVLVVAVFSYMGWSQARSSHAAETDMEIELPAPAAPAAPEPSDGSEPGTGVAVGLPTGAGADGIVELDLTGGEFVIRAAEPGDPLRVEGRFDENGYELVREVDDGAPWRASIRFGPTRGGLINSLAKLFGAETPRIVVLLPRDARLTLDVTMSNGALERFDLAGLDIESVDVTARRGALILDVSEPLATPAESLVVDVAMGAGVLQNVGNASPAEVRVEGRMGGFKVDLTGAWRRDAEIRLESSMSGMEVDVPADVGIQGIEPPGMSFANEADLARPVLTIVTDGKEKSGEIKFRKR